MFYAQSASKACSKAIGAETQGNSNRVPTAHQPFEEICAQSEIG